MKIYMDNCWTGKYFPLQNQKNLKVISRVGVGIDSLDLEFLKNKIKVLNYKRTNNSVADVYHFNSNFAKKIIPNYSLVKRLLKPV